MRIGIDFDRVLFKTDEFKEYLNNQVEGLEHVEASPYNEHGVYSPEIHAELLDIDEGEIYNAIKDLERFTYEDISELEGVEHEIILVTRGLSKFQEAKIEASGVKNLVDDIIIIEKGSKEVANIDFLIDDQKKEIEESKLPGFVIDREKHSLKEALEEAERHAA